MQIYQVSKSKLAGQISLPASKSQTIRAILFASLAGGTSVKKNYLASPDIFAMIAACEQLGAVISVTETQLTITGCASQPISPSEVIDCGNSGQVLRFIACLAGLQPGEVTLTGDASICHNRPVKPLIKALPKLGVECYSLKNNNHAPIVVKGPFITHETELDGQDSQPVSGLLMALAFFPGEHQVKVTNPGETPWIDLTLSWLDKFNIHYQNDHYQDYKIVGCQGIKSFEYEVPGDLSSMAYPLVAAIITQSELTINHVDLTEPQGDKAIIKTLQAMGANIIVNADKQSICVKPCEKLQATTINANYFIDAVPILAVAACFAEGETVITGAAIARQKESDRLAAITQELTKMGAKIQQLPDGLVISPSQLHAAEVDSHHDHRIAMSLAVAAMAIEGETIINDVDCVQKSFPEFAKAMQAIGAKINVTK